MAAGLVEGQHLAVDGILVAADGAQSRVSREQLVEMAQLSRTVRQYLSELEQQNPAVESDSNTLRGTVFSGIKSFHLDQKVEVPSLKLNPSLAIRQTAGSRGVACLNSLEIDSTGRRRALILLIGEQAITRVSIQPWR
jgi:hypothetical protein